jgi:hypothetical protein
MKRAVVYDLPGHFGDKGINEPRIWELVGKYGLEALYFDIRQINNHILDGCRQHHTTGGIWIDPKNWFNEDLAPAALRVTRKLNDLGFVGKNVAAPCHVLFDYEFHGIAEVVAGLQTWRKTRYKRDTIWSFEPLQGGWVCDPQMQAQIKHDTNLILSPQTYRFDMSGVVEDAVLWDLLRAYDRRQIKLTYQSEHLPIREGWDGVIYDLDHMT